MGSFPHRAKIPDYKERDNFLGDKSQIAIDSSFEITGHTVSFQLQNGTKAIFEHLRARRHFAKSTCKSTHRRHKPGTIPEFVCQYMYTTTL